MFSDDNTHAEQRLVDAIRRLAEYDAALRKAREGTEADTQSPVPDELLAKAHGARDAYYMLLETSVNVLKRARDAGELARTVSNLQGKLKEGEIRLLDLWQTAASEVHEKLSRIGLGEHLIERLDPYVPRVFEEYDVAACLYEEMPALRYGENNVTVLADSRTKRHASDQFSITIRPDPFLVAADSISRSGYLGVSTVLHYPDAPLYQPAELHALAGLIEGAKAIESHVAGLEEHGLTAHRGDDPVTAIVIGVAVVGAGIGVIGVLTGSEALQVIGFAIFGAACVAATLGVGTASCQVAVKVISASAASVAATLSF